MNVLYVETSSYSYWAEKYFPLLSSDTNAAVHTDTHIFSPNNKPKALL